MSRRMAKVLTIAAVLAMGGCAEMRSKMPDWMPGSGAARVSLSGAAEAPPVKTSGSGSGSFRLAEDGTLSGSITTEGVKGTAAHIHLGVKGKNGPVIVPLDKSGDTYSVPEGRKLTAAQVKAFKQGELYVNVHSRLHKNGEVRAQIEP